jgi:hypothetical protein
VAAAATSDWLCSSRWRYRGLEEQLIDVAPTPILARLEALHDRKLRPVKVLRRVLPLRLIAASDMAAFLAEAQVNPVHAERETFLATVRSFRDDVAHLIDMAARLSGLLHRSSRDDSEN